MLFGPIQSSKLLFSERVTLNIDAEVLPDFRVFRLHLDLRRLIRQFRFQGVRGQVGLLVAIRRRRLFPHQLRGTTLLALESDQTF